MYVCEYMYVCECVSMFVCVCFGLCEIVATHISDPNYMLYLAPLVEVRSMHTAHFIERHQNLKPQIAQKFTFILSFV